MKVSEQFKSTIKAYLDNMAAVDSLFAPVYQKPTKNIDNCITYPLAELSQCILDSSNGSIINVI